METIAEKIAHNIAETLHYDSEKEAVVAYGMIALLQTVVTILLVVILGIVFHVLVEALIIVFSVSILRKFSGGSHASSIELCTAASVVYSIGCALLIKYVLIGTLSLAWILVGIGALFLIAYLIIYKNVPVDSPNKPIRSKTKIDRMRKGSFLTITIYFVIAIILAFMSRQYQASTSYLLAMGLGIAWQISSLTVIGKKIADTF